MTLGRHPNHTPSLLRVGLGLALALIAAAPVLGQTLATWRGEVAVHDAEGHSYLTSLSLGRIELPLPAESRISDLRSSPTAWYLAAVRHDGTAPALEILRGKGTQVERLSSPAVDASAELLQPVFVADHDGIEGLVWLAGEAHDQLAVEAARWLDDHWSAPRVLSPPGKGTQIALSTAVLDDGSWLVVWAAFDGRDDEILWSRWQDGDWSPPLPVANDNAVPDITPHLYPTAGGALVVWSRYDGNDYRVHVARFDGEAWKAPRVIGPKGSTAPAFSDSGAPTLTYLQADPRAWGVMQLDASGKVLREASIEASDALRPRIATLTDQGVTLEWRTFDDQKVSAPLPWVER